MNDISSIYQLSALIIKDHYQLFVAIRSQKNLVVLSALCAFFRTMMEPKKSPKIYKEKIIVEMTDLQLGIRIIEYVRLAFSTYFISTPLSSKGKKRIRNLGILI